MRPDSKQPSAPWAWYTVDVFAEFHDYEATLYSTRMIRTANWKYVYNPATEDEPYDLRSGSGRELHNLAGMVFALVGQLPGLTLSGVRRVVATARASHRKRERAGGSALAV